MAFRGEGVPGIRTKYGEIIHLPSPERPRDERYVVDQVQYTDPTGARRKGRKRFRFEGRYRFTNVDEGLINTLSDLDNNNDSVWLIPHIDFPYVKIECDFTLTTGYLQGYPAYDTIELEFRGVYLLKKRPDIDSLVGGFRPTHVGVINPETLEEA